MSVKDRVIFVPRGPRGLPGPQGLTGNASTETARIDELENIDPGNRTLYLDAINGNDLNSGYSTGDAVATFQKAISLCRSFGFNYVNILSDVTLDYRIPMDNLNGVLFLRGRNAASTDSQQRKITVIDATNIANRPGSFVVNCNMSIRLDSLDVELNTSKGWGIFELTVAYLQYYMINGSLSRLGIGNARLFHTGFGAISARFDNFQLNNNAEGYLFGGVPAGDNPNDQFNYFSNLISG